jgi:NSS family neurotransmitter:Na+ symporter
LSDDKKKMEWGSRVGVILAVAGSAVGLGNYLRFPGQAVQYGGGAFMIPYICALLLLALPIGWAEWAMARHGGEKGVHSGPFVMGIIGRGKAARYVGVLSVMIPLTVYMYYVYIESWCLRYSWDYLVGNIDLGATVAAQKQASGELFQAATGVASDGSIFDGFNRGLVFFAVVVVLNITLVYRGLSGGIEKFCSYALPVMAVLSVVVLIRVLTLGTPDPAHPDQSVVNGLGFMWNPDFSKLAQADTWMAAAGQIFFSLSVGFGVILNYASYLKKKDDIALSGLTASATNELFEVGFGGLITVTAAFVFLGVTGVAGGTFAVGFNSLPVVFAQMGALGRFIGFAWFFLLFLAAITSSISMLQPAKAFFEESLGVTPARAITLVSGLCLVGSVWVIYFSKGLVALDTMDFWIGTFAIFLLATAQIICFGWVFGLKKGAAELDQGALIKIPRVFFFIMKYVAPVYLLTVLGMFAWQKLPEYLKALGDQPVAVWTMALMGTVLVILLLLIRAGEKRLRERGIDIDDIRPEVEPGP